MGGTAANVGRMKKRPFTRNYLLIGAIVIIIVLAFVWFNQPQTPIQPQVTISVQPEAPGCLSIELKYGEDVFEADGVIIKLNESELQEPGRYELPKSVYASLPDFPADFDEVTNRFQAGKVPLNNLAPEYWKQPDFYPNFQEAGVPLIKYYPSDSHAAFGFGTYPSEYIVTTGSDAAFEVYFIIRADWGVLNYQGLKLVPSYPSKIKTLRNAFSDGSTLVEQDPNYARCNIQITEINPGQLTLEPAYPGFSPGWAKRVELKLRTGELKPGKYAVGLDVVEPDEAYNSAMSEKLSTSYVTGGGFGTDRPWLMLYIEVK